MSKYSFEDYAMTILGATITMDDMKDLESVTQYSAKILKFCDVFSQLMKEINKGVAQHGNLVNLMEQSEQSRH